MNPIEVSQHLNDALVNYLTTIFDVNRDGEEEELADEIAHSFNQPNALFTGPYLELTSPYKTGKSIRELAQEGVVSLRLLDLPSFKENRPLPLDTKLYTHQEKSIRNLIELEQNIVVSSGTGSGKTECFLLPILNDLLVDPEPGVRAVIVYPLNALVNDQLDRLRMLLRGTNITFGRYTGELLENTDQAREEFLAEYKRDKKLQEVFQEYPLPNEIISRQQIRQEGKLPQILITNYAMLELLLLRPADSPLFGKGRWKYIVLDEAHTYSGAQGIEVGMLIRRLKHRLGKQEGELRCIATSATLVNDEKESACNFAEALFGEIFSEDDIIFGEPNLEYFPQHQSTRSIDQESYLDERFDNLLAEIRKDMAGDTDEIALQMVEIGLITPSDLDKVEGKTPSAFLWTVLEDNPNLLHLRQYMMDEAVPVEISALASAVFEFEAEEDRLQALYRLVELASMARYDLDSASLLPARYHLFGRPPQGIWICLNKECSEKMVENQPWSRIYASPRERCACGAYLFPLVVCRACGQPYVRAEEVKGKYVQKGDPLDEPQTRYCTWKPLDKNLALGETDEGDDEEILLKQNHSGKIRQEEKSICLRCQTALNRKGECACDTAPLVANLLLMVEERGKKKTTSPITNMNECGRCHNSSLKGTEIVTQVQLSTMTPLTNLLNELYQSLPVSTDEEVARKPGGGRKLLSFYDSRQGAARFAAYVQDVVNEQSYRHVIYHVINESSDYLEFEEAAENGRNKALDQKIFQNDPFLEEEDLKRKLNRSSKLNRVEKRKLLEHMRARVYAAFTTEKRSRYSLETLGLIGVGYFDPDPEYQLDFSWLSDQIELSEDQTKTLLEYLLDDLRRSKIVSLPEGVDRDNPIFGRNRFEPRVVRSGDKPYQLSWAGKTPRHRRRRLIKKIYAALGRDLSDDQVLNILNNIFDWLVDPDNEIFEVSDPSEGYQIRSDRLYLYANLSWFRCNKCQRLNCRGDLLICSHPYCIGQYTPIDVRPIHANNYFAQKLKDGMLPMRVEEHTAQLTSKKGQEYQDGFKKGDVNILSCSTTFEMGIDLGDLQAVVMSNIPPSVSNYKQRAGRAGRRINGTAFILSWASDRPHDQTYYRNPTEIISGNVRIPYLAMENPVIARRHFNAILLSAFLLERAKTRQDLTKVGPFFDSQTIDGPHIDSLTPWLNQHEGILIEILKTYDQGRWSSQESILEQLDHFEDDMTTKGREYFTNQWNFYTQSIENLLAQQKDIFESASDSGLDGIGRSIRRFRRLRDRLKQDDLIKYLSNRGVLPSYSFPLHTVELWIPDNKELRLQRDLRQAIREYAPGQEVVANKKIWKSVGLEFFGNTPIKLEYWICPACNHLRLESTPGKRLDGLNDPCPICGEPPKRGGWKPKKYIKPDGFKTGDKSGEPAGQYIDIKPNFVHSALLQPSQVPAFKARGSILETGYDRSGTLLYVNEGALSGGFRLCLRCGREVEKGTECPHKYRGDACGGKVGRQERYMLGTQQETDTLHIKFREKENVPIPSPESRDFWLSLKYALIFGACKALQIERRDIDGVLFPISDASSNNWAQTVVLYDNVPGGAGHVRQIEKHLSNVVVAALEIVDCDCHGETSCYRCLRDYGNQNFHHQLRRGGVEQFLKALYSDLNDIDDMLPGVALLSANNPRAWLLDKISGARRNVLIAASSINLEPVDQSGRNWLDIFQDLMLKGVDIQLYLEEIPVLSLDKSESLYLGNHLRLLLDRGFKIFKSNRPKEWPILIDPGSESSVALRFDDGNLPILNETVSDANYELTENSDVGQDLLTKFNVGEGRLVTRRDLQSPRTVKVIEVKKKRGIKRFEPEFFNDFYQKDVRTMVINDRYLNTEDRIIERLGSHMTLANRNSTLRSVVVYAMDGQNSMKRGISKLKQKFPEVKIVFPSKRGKVDHDRHIIVERVDGSKARVIIGHGIDFIQKDGEVEPTFLIFEDPFNSS